MRQLLSHWWLEAAEALPAESDQPWLCWRSLNRLRTGIGRAKTTMRRWGYVDDTTVASRKQWPTSSAAGYLMSLAPTKISSPPQRGQRHVPGSGNTLCEGHKRTTTIEAPSRVIAPRHHQQPPHMYLRLELVNVCQLAVPRVSHGVDGRHELSDA